MVRIEVQGEGAALDAFVDALRRVPPPQARIDAIDVQETPLQDDTMGANGRPIAFQIDTSTGASSPRPTIPADLATCPECLAEIRDPSQRRHNYPFTNCTNCGPRWSIIEQLPYDRSRTSMARFAMCAACRAEYDNPADRRFHAQPIACPRCGPTLQLLDRAGRETAAGDAALAGAVQAVLTGRVVAIKGLGGFQLLTDATNAEAVALLRRRKRRPDRPFAVMLPSLDDVRQHCEVSDEEARVLFSHQSPIVLLRKLTVPPSPVPRPSPPVPGVAPGNPYLGVMLPYTPLHHLLMAAVARPIVCTSGNLSDEPMAITTEDAIARLGAIADVLLTHDRPIVRPVDDSIVRLGVDGVQVLRRARGFAPLPIELRVEARNTPTILAVGGHLKNTVALALGRVRETHHEATQRSVGWVERSADPPSGIGKHGGAALRSTHPTQVVMSAHIGDLDSVLGVDVFRRAADDLLGFFQVVPDAVVCDLHPDYASTRHAELLSARWDVPLLRIQHHHAHVAACMAEHGLQGPALGFAWDGAGYGPDATVWGGEALVCDGVEFRRAAHLRTFALPGGDRAAREPRRSALGVLFEIFGLRAADHAAAWFNAGQLDTLISALARHVNAPRTSSMGRLFDAVAAICGLPPATTKPRPVVAPRSASRSATTGRGFMSNALSFEGQAAMALEFAADEHEEIAYSLPVHGEHPEEPLVADWEPLVRSVLADRAAGVHVGRISARFHNALADMAVAIARSVAPTKARLPVVLTGGCFQNALLTARVRSRLSAAGFRVYTHQKVPPGDGGIALGQVFLALQQLQGSSDVSRNPG